MEILEILLNLAYVESIDPFLWLSLHGLGTLLVILLSVMLFQLGQEKIWILGIISLLNPITELAQYLQIAPVFVKDYLSDISFVAFWSLILIAPLVLWIRVKALCCLGAIAFVVFVLAVFYELCQYQVNAGQAWDLFAYLVSLLTVLLIVKKESQAGKKTENGGGLQEQGGKT